MCYTDVMTFFNRRRIVNRQSIGRCDSSLFFADTDSEEVKFISAFRNILSVFRVFRNAVVVVSYRRHPVFDGVTNFVRTVVPRSTFV